MAVPKRDARAGAGAWRSSPIASASHRGSVGVNNSTSTVKYRISAGRPWFPFAIIEQFRRLANIYYLFVSMLMVIAEYSPSLWVTPYASYTTAGVLAFVLVLTAFKEGLEDLKRYQSDLKENNTLVTARTPVKAQIRWKELTVGDLIIVHDREALPADAVLLTSAAANGVAYVDTANIDGETNLKLREPPGEVALALGANQDAPIGGSVSFEPPSRHIHSFNGSIKLELPGKPPSAELPLSAQTLLLRGSVVRNVEWILAVVVYTGAESKVALNSQKTPSKMSNVERTINTSLGAIMVPYLVFSGVSAGIAAGTTYLTPYLFQSGDGISSSIPILLSYFFTFFILYCFLIPISLYVTIEIVNLLQAYLITSDREMYDPVSDTPAIARSSNLCQELGQIQYVFSDKTGTLTANEMVLRYLSLAGQDLVASLPPAPADAIHAAEDAKELAQLAAAAGGQPAATAAAPTAAAADGGGAPAAASPLRATSVPLENLLRLPAGRPGGVSALPADASSSGLGLLVTGESSETVRARCAAELLAVCHTVLPQRVGARLVYQGESPDEVALVEAAASVGYRLIRREVDDVVIAVGVSAADAPVGTAAGHCPAGCDELRVKVLAVNQFNSTRKRMSCLVKYPDGSLVLYVKGADTNMFPLLDARAHSGDDAARTEAHLRTYAREGLRTLVLAKRTLTSSQAAEWLAKFKAASVSRGDRDAELAAAAEDVERGLSLVALTAIEDRLQRGVPQTLDHLRRAGLKVWVLTGDKVETAVNIGFAAKLLVPEMTLLYLGLKPDGGGPPATTESLRAELRELTTHYAAQILKQLPHLADALNHHGEFELGPGRRKGPSNGLRTVFARVERSSATLTQRLFRTRPASSKAAEVEGGALALIVDGAALTLIMDDDALKEATLHLGRICASVLACRVSPKQKAQVVELVRKGVRPEPLTLSIGDGANDVGMIQAAHVGVGISGKEGMQAVNSSDFAIAQFRFLERLLLLHGRWNYSRMSKVVLYYYYKNFVLSLTLFVYNFQSAFSGTSIYESLMASGYNVILFLPIVFVGALDQDVSARMVQRQPELYVTGRTNMHLNTPKVAATMFNGLITGGVVVAIAAAMQRTNTSGGSLYVLGATVYTWLFFIMQGKLVLEASHWSQALNACWWAHNFVYILFLVVYSYLPSVSPDFEGAGVQALASLNFWLSTVVVVGASLMLDTAFESLRLQYAPTIVDIFKEIDRGYGEGSIDDAVRAQSALGRLRESLGIFRTPRRLAAPARSGAAADADKRSAYDSTHPEMSQSKRAEIHDANVARSASRNVGARPPIRNA